MSEDDTGARPLIVSIDSHDTHLVATQPAEHQADGTRLVRYQAVSGSHVVKVLVESRSAQAVVLRALRAIVLSRQPPQPVRDEVGIASALWKRPCTVDLDHEPPEVVAEGIGFPRTVTASDPETFVIRPLSTVDEVRWQLELDWTYAGRPGTTVIPDDDRGFLLYPRG